jgi:anthranilate phosphoribosyltransferase
VRDVAEIDQAPPEVTDVFHRLNVRAPVELELLGTAFEKILHVEDAHLRDLLLSGFLMSVMTKGPELQEIEALLRVAFSLDGFSPSDAVKVRLPRKEKLIGCAGSGKKGTKTMNISTPSALLAAAAGVYVSKTGSSSTSSISGSADFLSTAGANLRLPVAEMVAVLKRLRFGFFRIEALVPNFDRVYGGRFHAPHALSFALAGLVTPIHLDHRLYGLSHPNVEMSLKVFRRFGVENALVVSSTHDDIHYIDEMGIYGTTRLMGMRNGRIGRLLYLDPTVILRLPRYTPKDLAQGRNLRENVAIGLRALRGAGPQSIKDVVCINAANLMVLAEKADDLRHGFSLAKSAMRKGLAIELLESFIDSTGGDVAELHARI